MPAPFRPPGSNPLVTPLPTPLVGLIPYPSVLVVRGVRAQRRILLSWSGLIGQQNRGPNFDCTWIWASMTSPTLKVCCYFTLFQRSRRAVILYYIRIYNTDIANWEFVDTSCKYLNIAWLLYGFRVGVSNSSVSRGYLNCLPTDANMGITLVSLIWALFHVYWYIFFVLDKDIMNTPVLSCDRFCFV